jgi:hypothetical protein
MKDFILRREFSQRLESIKKEEGLWHRGLFATVGHATDRGLIRRTGQVSFVGDDKTRGKMAIPKKGFCLGDFDLSSPVFPGSSKHSCASETGHHPEKGGNDQNGE